MIAKTSVSVYVFDMRSGELAELQSTPWKVADVRVLKADPSHGLLVLGTATTLFVTAASR